MITEQAFWPSTFRVDATTELELDVFAPTSDSRRCAILIFHGGGWRAGAKEFVHPQAAALAAVGFTAVAVQYRLLDAAAWPAQRDDAAAALTWVRENADSLDIDPTQVVVQGHSAGAHLALMTGTAAVAERPAAIVAYYPPIGFYPAPPPEPVAPPAMEVIELDELGRFPSGKLLPPDASEAEIDAASPYGLVDADYPPTVLFHATADRMINPRSSVAFHQRLLELGVSTELHIYADRDHVFDAAPSMMAATVPAAASFLRRVVTHRAESEEEARQYVFPPGART
jgi:acetyl esterase/lipase